MMLMACLLTIGLAALAAGFSSEPSPETGDTPREQRAMDAHPAVARGIVDVEGGIVQLASSRDGIVRAVLVEEGEKVVSGQALAVLDDRTAQLARDVANAELIEAEAAILPLTIRLDAAERERNRLLPLARSGAVARKAFDETSDTLRLSRSQLDAQRSAVVTARARRAAAEHEIDQRTIRAPSDGVIVRRLARAGDGVSTLNVTTLFWLAPTTSPIVRAEIEESFADKVRPGMTANVVSESNEASAIDARVLRVGRAFGPRRITVHDPRDRADVRVVEVILGFDVAPEHVLLGQRVIVRFRDSDGAPHEVSAAAHP
jgi:HlyD family secretion protein